ncbi:MAG: hypothetical protein AAGD06_16355 [Acidobacteriota bacterium]
MPGRYTFVPKPSTLLTLAILLAAASATVASAETLVVANKSDATASLIDLGTGEVVATLPTGPGPHEVAISPSGRRALVTDYGPRGEPGSTLTLLDVATAKVVKTVDMEIFTRPHGAVWLDEHRVAVTAEDQQAVVVVDMAAGWVEKAVPTGQEISHMLAVEGNRGYVANIGSGTLTVVDLATGKHVADVPTGDGAEGVAVAGGHVWVTNRAADTVSVLDVSTLAKVKDMDSPGFPIRAMATPDGSKVLVTRARGGDLVIYDAENVGASRTVDLGMKATELRDRLFGDRFGDSSVPIGVIVDRDGRRAWIAHANADVISEHDLETAEQTRILKAGREPDGMGFTPVSVVVR